jgi:ribose-phosphate pyrophosphokinase
MLILNNKKIENDTYKNGELYVYVNPSYVLDHNTIKINLDSNNSIVELLFVVDAIKRINTNATFELFFPYVAYTRQDHIKKQGEAFPPYVVTQLINTINASKVTLFDPHSMEIQKFLNNVHVIEQHELIYQSPLFNFILSNNFTIVCPDAGESKKIKKLYSLIKQHGYEKEIYYCQKERFKNKCNIILPQDDIKMMNCIIIDDLCDQGTTVLETAKKLKSVGVQKLYFYVTHGVFSDGIEKFKDSFDHIFCYHNLLYEKERQPSFLTVFTTIEDF